MKIQQYTFQEGAWQPPIIKNDAVNWVLIFGSIKDPSQLKMLQAQFPNALVTGCTTAGEIFEETVQDNALVVTTVSFEHGTRIRGEYLETSDTVESFEAGQTLAERLLSDDLSHVFIISEGLNINGSELIKGINLALPDHILVTGGLSGDDGRFEKTFQYFGERIVSNGIIAVGFYGDKLKVGHGSVGGWKAFGPERIATKTEGNILYELDGQSALELYKQYLGDYADELPASGLRFPLKISGQGVPGEALVRTILGVNEEEGSLIFAGDIPQGCQAQLMMTNSENLVEGAQNAAEHCIQTSPDQSTELAILISCVGRKLLMQQRIEEEVEVVRQTLGEHATLTGFYSYGEICPVSSCQGALHNQTMTITTLSEG